MHSPIEEKAAETGFAVIGLGYVGLPVAMALARRFGRAAPPVWGFDISEPRLAELRRGVDRTREGEAAALAGTSLKPTRNPPSIPGCSFFIVTVPTPIDAERRPDLGPLLASCRTVGSVMR